MTIKDIEPARGQDTASALFGMDGVAVTEAERDAGGRLTVWARVTRPAVCPECGTVSGKVHQYVTTRPRDVRACGQDVEFCLVKRRMRCADAECPRRTFTEWVPQVPQHVLGQVSGMVADLPERLRPGQRARGRDGEHEHQDVAASPRPARVRDQGQHRQQAGNLPGPTGSPKSFEIWVS